MGRVFALEEVRRGHVPQLQNFVIAEDHLVSLLKQSEYAEISALPFGAVGYLTPSRRSDFDVLIYYPDDQQDQAIQLIKDLKIFADELFIILDPVWVSHSGALVGHHDIRKGFEGHLRKMEKRGLGKCNQILENLKSLPISLDDELRHYLYLKRRMICDAQAIGHPTTHHHFRYLQRQLEAPIHIARRHLQCLGYSADRKMEVLLEYERYVESPLSQRLTTLNSLDKFYSHSLGLMLETGAFDPDKYAAALYQVEQGVPLLLEFIDRTFVSLQQLALEPV